MSTETSSAAEVKFRDTDRPKQFRHWVRPKSSLYSYIYDYHRSYYDDIIDYLDRRRRGISSEIPRPQTWAERAFRTYTQRLDSGITALQSRNDHHLIQKVHNSRITHDNHARDYSAKRFTFVF